MPGPQGVPRMQGGGGGLYINHGRGGNNAARGSNRRRRPNNQQGQQQESKYTQTNGFEEDDEFQPKLPSDTAPAFRFVERRGRRNKGGARNAGPGGQHNHHHSGQGGGRHQIKDPPQLKALAPQPAVKPATSLSSNLQEDITPKTIRIVSASSKPETSDESLNADTCFSGSSLVEKTPFQEARSTPPTLPEPVEARSKPQLEAGQDTVTDDTSVGEEEGGVPVSWTMASDAQSETPVATAAEKLTTEEPKKISIRELLDTSDIELTPHERFLKLSDVTSRYLTEHLGKINYNPDLSRRLKSDLEVIESAYNTLRFDRSLNPNRILWHTLIGLKKAIELRNNDAKIVGALKEMSQTYDTVRHQALHERRFDGDQLFNFEAGNAAAAATAGKWRMDNSGVQAVAKAGENLMDTLKWNIRGGDTNVGLYGGNGNAGCAVMRFGNPGLGAPNLGSTGFGTTTGLGSTTGFGTTTTTDLGNTGFATTTSSSTSGFSTVGFSTFGFNPAAVDITGFGTPNFKAPSFRRAAAPITPWGPGRGDNFLTLTKPGVPPQYGIIGGHLK
ncbi:uncharacterized protein DFL_003100 [Arthrobotrys flagrans]|uniref:Uncharacterized protein n=1 Tax=Arthrobotrys flagrans TaxID=97331 RepID=A0A437ACU0_ARTFL|nr:hypothetical protein DFL_003100 [Arthrobotrys flagrans]